METVKVTNRKLKEMNAALVLLGNRRMSNLGADLKVAKLLRALAPHVEPLDGVQRKAVQEILAAAPGEMDESQRQKLQIDINEKQAELDAEEVTVELPMAYVLKEADLPKEQTGADGWKNASQLGAVVTDLGILYDFGDRD